MRQRRPTRREVELLRMLADGRWVADEGNRTNYTPGMPGRTEQVLSRMADEGWVLWADGIDDVTITAAGRAVVPSRK